MEKEENKLKYEDISELMEKITLAMEMTGEKQRAIDEMVEEIYDQPLSMKVEDQKKEIEIKKKEKAEFDEMTKDALISAKKLILQVREDSEKQYQEKLVETAKEQNSINKKLTSIKKRLTDEQELDKISIAEEKANNALKTVSNEMKEFQNKHFKLRKDLDLHEKNILNFAIELGVVEQIEKVTLEQTKSNENKIEKVVITEKKPEQVIETQHLSKQGKAVKSDAIISEQNAGETHPKTDLTIKPKETSAKWHPNLTEAQIDYIRSELGIYEPVGQEYEQALNQLGINKVKNNENDKKQKSQWHPDLTEAQIDYIRSELGIYEPVGQEYRQALKQLGINKEKQTNNISKDIKKEPVKEKISGQTEQELKKEKMQKVAEVLAKGLEKKQRKEPVIEPVVSEEQISILFNANSRSYILNRSVNKTKQDKYITLDHITIKLDDIIYDKGFQEFNEQFIEKHGEIVGLDPYIAYIISNSNIDKEHAGEILEEYVDAMSGNKEVGEEGLDLLKISYDMSGIYGRQYPSKVSDQLMNYANAHSAINCASVNIDDKTAFFEKHKILRKIYRGITNRGKIEDRLLPEPRQDRKNESKKQTTLDEKQKENKKKINIPTYSEAAMNILSAETYKSMRERLYLADRERLTVEDNKAIEERMVALYNKEKEKQISNDYGTGIDIKKVNDIIERVEAEREEK